MADLSQDIIFDEKLFTLGGLKMSIATVYEDGGSPQGTYYPKGISRLIGVIANPIEDSSGILYGKYVGSTVAAAYPSDRSVNLTFNAASFTYTVVAFGF